MFPDCGPAKLFISSVNQACSISTGIYLEPNSSHCMPLSSCFSPFCTSQPSYFCLVLTLWRSPPHLSFIKVMPVPFCWLQSSLLWPGPLLIPLRLSLIVKSLALTDKESQVSGIGNDWCFTRIFPKAMYPYEVMLPTAIGRRCWLRLECRRCLSTDPHIHLTTLTS